VGFFKNIFKKPKNLFKSVAKIGTKATTIVATGGLSLVSSKIRKTVNPLSAQLFPSSFSQVARLGLGVATRNPSFFLPQQRGANMGFNIGGLLQGIGGALGNVQGANAGGLRALGTVSSIIGSGFTVAPRATPVALRQPSMNPVYGQRSILTRVKQQNSNLGGAVVPLDVTQAGMMLLDKLGVSISSASAFVPALKRSLSALSSFARRTPTGTVISVLLGLGLSQMAATSLIAWYATKKKYRRMNPANAKALRRAARRIKGFHRLCQHTDLIKTRSRSSGRGRCGSCKKSPCRC
jgi:hypothetical protein